MKPRHDTNAPSLDPAVRARLARLDRRLFLTWSERFIDPETGAPVKREDGTTVIDPHFYLWMKCDDGKTRLCSMHERFGNEELAALERNAATLRAAGTSLGRFFHHLSREREEMQQRRLAGLRERIREKIAANTTKIRDFVFDGKQDVRQARPFSAPGLGARGTPGEIEMDAKEAGWELYEPA